MRALVRVLLLAVLPVLVVVAPGAAPSHACSCATTSFERSVGDVEAVTGPGAAPEPGGVAPPDAEESDGTVSLLVLVLAVAVGAAGAAGARLLLKARRARRGRT